MLAVRGGPILSLWITVGPGRVPTDRGRPPCIPTPEAA
jgi:hypothetical protein